MQIVFLIRPYVINMYSYENDTYTLLGNQDISRIEKESNTDYENRMIYVCKDICQDFLNTDIYKNNKNKILNIKVILTNPWCVYEVINLEKKFDKPQFVNKDFIDKIIVNKAGDDFFVLKNSLFNISLNGYNVNKIKDYEINQLHLQYLSIYCSKNLFNRLKNTLETLFHLHDVYIDSVYSYINENNNLNNKKDNQLKIIVEDYGIDLSYIYQGKNISSSFISCGCVDIKDKLKQSLHIDDMVLNKILKSKSVNLDKKDDFIGLYDKNINNIWLDLDQSMKNKIDDEINNGINSIKKQISIFLDSIENEFISKDTNINIYCLNEESLFNIGSILDYSIKNDTYILNKLLTNELNIFTKKIF